MGRINVVPNEGVHGSMSTALVATHGECKEGAGVAYNGVWGYHALLISLANTGEPRFLV